MQKAYSLETKNLLNGQAGKLLFKSQFSYKKVAHSEFFSSLFHWFSLSRFKVYKTKIDFSYFIYLTRNSLTLMNNPCFIRVSSVK